MNVKEAFEILKGEGLTQSIQTVRRWIRNGDIKAEITNNRKDGYKVDEKSLQDFISKRNPGNEEVTRLKDEIKKLRGENKSLETSLNQCEHRCDSAVKDYEKMKKMYDELKEVMENQEPEVIETIPDDYDYYKGNYESAISLRDRYKEQLEEMRKELESRNGVKK